jgi:hypothetical protein
MLRFFCCTHCTQVEPTGSLSIGLVSEDGGFERLFEVLEDERDPRGSHTARDNVIPLFVSGRGAPISNQMELGRRLAAFLTARNEVVELCYDDKHDWNGLQSTLHAADRWTTMASRLRAHDVADEVCSDDANAAAEDASQQAEAAMRGHALTKAKALRAKWLARPAMDTSDFGRVRAYLGYGAPDDRGNTLDSTLRRDNDWYEDSRYFVQWMFPIAEPSQVKQDGPMLSAIDFLRLADDRRVHEGVMSGVVRLLCFLGLRLDPVGGGAVAGENWTVEWHRWARFPGHNDMRVSRMLRCLALIGEAELAKNIYLDLERLIRHTRGAEAAEPALAYWRAAAYR